jgi:hypothetical protein
MAGRCGQANAVGDRAEKDRFHCHGKVVLAQVVVVCHAHLSCTASSACTVLMLRNYLLAGHSSEHS